MIGGTLFIGRVLVAKLRAAGHNVAVLHRKPEHDLGADVESIQADRNDGNAVQAALSGRKFDAVFDNVFDWTRGTTADQVVACARACNTGRLQRYVFMSSVAAYGDCADAPETAPLAADTHPDLYARHKAMSERALFGLSGLPAVTLRPPFIYGPGNPYYREAYFWDRFAAGRAVMVPNQGERMMQFIHVEDLADCAMRCLDVDAAVGEAFNVAGVPISQLDLVRALAAALGKVHAEIYGIPRDEILRAGGQVMGPNFYFAEYLDLPPIAQHISKAQRLLGFEARPFSDGLAANYRWWQAARPVFPQASDAGAGKSFAFEDGLLSCDSRVRLAAL